VEKYNIIVRELNRKRYEGLVYSIIASILTGLIFMHNPVFSYPLALVKVVWLPSLPYFIAYALGRHRVPRELYIDREIILRNKRNLINQKVIFQLVTRGF